MEQNDFYNDQKPLVNELFCKIFEYNSFLLKQCNEENDEPDYSEIFDFYITSHAMTFLKNFYFECVDSPASFFNIRCILEGIALIEAFRNGYFSELNFELLKRQYPLIEYNQYKKFNDVYENFLIPKEYETSYKEACDFYKSTLFLTKKCDLNRIINSQIPFTCDPNMSYNKIIENNLGKETANYYSFISVLIHPTSNTPLGKKVNISILNNVITLLKERFSFLPTVKGELSLIESDRFASKEAIRFNNLIMKECSWLEAIEIDFKKNLGENYVSDTMHTISMTIQEMMSDSVYGFSEQVKSKWKVMLELLAGFYNVHINNGNDEESFRMLQLHDDVNAAIFLKRTDKKQENLKLAYNYYKKKYTDGVDFEKFVNGFIRPAGFTIDNNGKVKSLNQLVNDLCNLFQYEGIKSPSYIMRLDYVEAQMVSHANGYLWYANTGAWGDINPIFINFNFIMEFICLYISKMYKDYYNVNKRYNYKKTSQVLKHAAHFFNSSLIELSELLVKRNGSLFD